MQWIKRFLKFPSVIQYLLFGIYFFFGWPWIVWKYWEIKKYQKLSEVDYEIFIQKYSKELNIIRLGCSFAPEMFEDQEEGLRALEFILGKLAIKEIRFGLRWNNIYKDGALDLAYYEPYLKLLFKNKADVCLNVGPIKTFRWPEEHIPKEIGNRPEKRSVISAESEFGRRALNYLRELLIILNKKYEEEDLRNIKSFQPENEGLHNFGVHSWTMTDDYYIQAIEIINESFPHSAILVNSAARLDLERVANLFKKVKNKLKNIKLISGYDYYHYYPGKDRFPFFKEFDNLVLTSPLAKSTEWNIQQAKKIGYEIEVTEAQFEPWFHLKAPGNDYSELQFTLLRIIKNILNPDQDISIVRLWGIEGFAKKFLRKEETSEHRQMLDLISHINRQ